MNELRSRFLLDPAIVFLNHGSFGACPREVLAVQDRFREQMEREPVRFFVRELPALLVAARERLATFLGAAADHLAFVRNATEGVNSVLRSLEFGPGDELLTTDHEYNACRNVLDFVAQRSGARVVIAEFPKHIVAEQELVTLIEACLTPRTRLLLIDHVTSPTGLVIPIAPIVAAARRRGIDVLVDGAHAPGMLDLHLEELGASWYTGNCHKWLCAPKGAAFLWARKDRRDATRPAIISHGANAPLRGASRFRLEFDWLGTVDPTPFLAVPAALDFLDGLQADGIAGVRERNRKLALEARTLLLEALGTAPLCPDSMIGSLAAVQLPEQGGGVPPLGPFDTDRLLHEFGIEVPIMPAPSLPGPPEPHERRPRRLIRISAAVYNEPADYQRLVAALARAT
jgi:isopenicillin-N epimerase